MATAPAEDVTAVVDARFDDASSLRRTLELPNTATDAAIVVAAHQRWGDEFPSRLNGDFALILWDARAGRLLAARDRLGIRPLYYGLGESLFVIASDPEQILASGAVTAAPDDDSVIEYLRWSFSGRENTFLRGVRRLRPGHTLVAADGTWSVTDHRRIESLRTSFQSKDDCWAEYRRLFEQAVRRRMESHHPIVVHLSGGLDSTAVACAANLVANQTPRNGTWIVGAAATHVGLPCDESAFIDAAAASLTFPVERWDGTAADPQELSHTGINAPGSRYVMTGGTAGDIDIARRLGAKVVLSGTGGDQLGVSDGVIEDALLEGRWQDALRFLAGPSGRSRLASARDGLSVLKALAPERLRRLHRSRQGDTERSSWMTPWAQERPRLALVPDLVGVSWSNHVQRRRWAHLTQPRHAFGIDFIQQHALRSGVDIRFPFADWDLARFVLEIPSRFWPPPWPQERLHRESLYDLLPSAIRKRRGKANFTSALTNRVKRQRTAIVNLLETGEWRASPYVTRGAARKCFERFEALPEPPFGSVWPVWAIASLEAWLRAISRYTARA